MDLLAALDAAAPCTTTAQLLRQLNWRPARLRAAMDALKIQQAVIASRPGCFRTTAVGKSILRAARTVAAQPAPRKGWAAKPARPRCIRQRLWRAMCILGKFTVPDLVGIAIQAGEDAGRLRRNVIQYVSGLEKAGYLQRLRTREKGTKPGSRGHGRYLLLPLMNTGPHSPRIGKNGRVYDPNRRQITFTPGAP